MAFRCGDLTMHGGVGASHDAEYRLVPSPLIDFDQMRLGKWTRNFVVTVKPRLIPVHAVSWSKDLLGRSMLYPSQERCITLLELR